MKENTIKAALAAALGALCAYGIQLLVPVLVLLVVMVLDYITGMAKAWHAGELSSRVGLWGILKKVGYLVIVGVACVVDWLLRYGADSLGWNWPVDFLFASIVIIWLVINELLSILENVSAIGAPVSTATPRPSAGRCRMGSAPTSGSTIGDRRVRSPIRPRTCIRWRSMRARSATWAWTSTTSSRRSSVSGPDVRGQAIRTPVGDRLIQR